MFVNLFLDMVKNLGPEMIMHEKKRLIFNKLENPLRELPMLADQHFFDNTYFLRYGGKPSQASLGIVPIRKLLFPNGLSAASLKILA
jgi:hypothetical protein